MNELAILWEPEQQITQPLPRTAVVLGGFAEYDAYRHAVTMSEAAERLYKAIELYRSHQIDTIVVSGGAIGHFKPESIYARSYLVLQGIDSTRVLIDTVSINTFQNARETAKLLENRNHITPVLLITTASHMPRAKRCFKKAGVAVVPYCVQYFSNPLRGYVIWDYFIPSTEALKKFDALSKEWVGYMVYRLNGKA